MIFFPTKLFYLVKCCVHVFFSCSIAAAYLFFRFPFQYEYVMTAKFGSDNNTEGLITCKVANGILEPFFVHSPVRIVYQL